MHSSALLLSSHQSSLPGIIGGLGPLAHIEFEKRLLKQSVRRGACRDQDHPVWLLINAAATPDRTKSLQGLDDDCSPWLFNYASALEQMGADFLVVTCNTAHAFHRRVQQDLTIPWIHMMRAVSGFIVHQYPQAHKIGVMATTGTLHAHLYSDSLQHVGLNPAVPALASDIQHRVMESIYAPGWGIKSSGASVSDEALKTLQQAVDWFAQQGADLVIAGCTELSVGLALIDNLALPWIDPLDVLADITISLALGEITLPALAAQLTSDVLPESVVIYPARSPINITHQSSDDTVKKSIL